MLQAWSLRCLQHWNALHRTLCSLHLRHPYHRRPSVHGNLRHHGDILHGKQQLLHGHQRMCRRVAQVRRRRLLRPPLQVLPLGAISFCTKLTKTDGFLPASVSRICSSLRVRSTSCQACLRLRLAHLHSHVGLVIDIQHLRLLLAHDCRSFLGQEFDSSLFSSIIVGNATASLLKKDSCHFHQHLTVLMTCLWHAAESLLQHIKCAVCFEPHQQLVVAHRAQVPELFADALRALRVTCSSLAYNFRVAATSTSFLTCICLCDYLSRLASSFWAWCCLNSTTGSLIW
mmetsp:Transcript_19058/g.34960  ORF Transcript_19058/g.34960 Transcript_19058/m.34960 type:complete len:286 (-) Transcript_19058:991-1848(-)